MNIKIQGYKNIKNFDYDITDNKANFLFGISGSGKSSIVEALKKADLDFNKTVNFNEEQIISIGGEDVDLIKTLIFDDNIKNRYIFDEESSSNVFHIFVDDDQKFINMRTNTEKILKNIKKDFAITKELYSSLLGLKKALGSDLKKDGDLKGSAKIKKIRDKYNSIPRKRTLDEINKMGTAHYKWIIDGEKKYLKNNICPFCERRLTQKRIKKINNYKEFDTTSVAKVIDSQDLLKNANIEFSELNKKGINLIYKGIIELCIALEEYNKIEKFINRYDEGLLLKGRALKLDVNPIFYSFFPNFENDIKDLNKNINQLKKASERMLLHTNKAFNRKISTINKVIEQFGIPYEIKAQYRKSKITEYKLKIKDDSEEVDRRKSLSNGERNIISFILFAFECETTTDIDIILIDDPVSSYDEYRRKLIFDLIMDKMKDQTVLVLSHDSVFAKFAVLETSKSKKNCLGKIDYFDNFDDIVRITKITRDDFAPFESFIEKRLKESIDYYQKIINLRLLYEGKYQSLEYKYLSAILHFKSKNEINKALLKEGKTEKNVINLIYKAHKLKLEEYDEELQKDIGKTSEYSLIEKAAFVRENTKSNKRLKAELNNLIHINTKLKVCLDPHKYNFCSSYTYKLVNEKFEEFTR